jgi:hypothetical protein
VAIDELTYPQPVADRSGPTPGAVAGLAPLAPPQPRSRAFWFELRTNATSRSVSCMPKIKGPAIIREIQWGMGGSPDATLTYLDIGVSPTQVIETNVALTALRQWRSLFENADPRTVNINTALHGFPSASTWGSTSDNRWPINHLVMDAEFFLVLALLNNAAAVRITFGTLYVVEGVGPDVVRNFR